ncbi:MAG: hypothetical protein HRU33_26720 [Rhodobacteraceae bacterium]|nr:hypothetical protein [Paracoccaceae bacterium]
MIKTPILAPVSELKVQAKRLRDRLRSSGHEISHSKSLELLAQQHGLRDWNTLSAQAGNKLHLRIGERVHGCYLGQRFAATIRSLTVLGDGEQRRIALHFDVPVDVVKFDSFSNFRQRVSGTIGWDGCSVSKTSDGVPQLSVELISA